MTKNTAVPEEKSCKSLADIKVAKERLHGALTSIEKVIKHSDGISDVLKNKVHRLRQIAEKCGDVHIIIWKAGEGNVAHSLADEINKIADDLAKEAV